MTISSGYRLPAWKPAGLCSTPSMGVPSWLFQVITSWVPSRNPAVWAPKSVSRWGFIVATGATNSSGKDVASPATKAVVVKSAEKLNDEPIHWSVGASFTTFFVAGSSRYR